MWEANRKIVFYSFWDTFLLRKDVDKESANALKGEEVCDIQTRSWASSGDRNLFINSMTNVERRAASMIKSFRDASNCNILSRAATDAGAL